ncbi:hypothetical protein ACEUZ9_000847, partial [Paracoccus litorisediminis]|uniref:hypothetical protein n=1 Tax=Paracoccus litorisediminis TaxID=2006130 RepID=UPI00373263E6
MSGLRPDAVALLMKRFQGLENPRARREAQTFRKREHSFRCIANLAKLRLRIHDAPGGFDFSIHCRAKIFAGRGIVEAIERMVEIAFPKAAEPCGEIAEDRNPSFIPFLKLGHLEKLPCHCCGGMNAGASKGLGFD